MVEPAVHIGAGLAVGGLVGLTGIGAGSLLTPILMLGFGEPPAVAIGTALAFAAIARLVAAAPFGPGAPVDWHIVRRIALGSLPAALGVLLWLAPRQPSGVDLLTLRGVACMLLVTALGLLLHGRLQRLGLRLTVAALMRGERAKPVLSAGLGALIGIAVTLTSIGGGALAAAVLVSLYPLRLSGPRLVATAVACALPPTVVAALGHAALGHLDLTVLGLLLLGAVPGVLLSRGVTWRFSPGVLRAALGVLLASCAAWMLAG